MVQGIKELTVTDVTDDAGGGGAAETENVDPFNEIFERSSKQKIRNLNLNKYY